MIEIRLFGASRVVIDGQALQPSSLSAKQRKILAILALKAGTPVPKERLADLLWEGSPPASYVGTLESYVCVLRRALGMGAGRTSLLATTSAGYVLDTGPRVSVDLHRFRELAHEAGESVRERAVTCTEGAIDLVVGDLLADEPYADWAVRAREVFGRALVDLCLRGAQRANGIGEFACAARFSRLAVERDPVCEEAWRQLMLAHWFSGRRCRALAVYSELRQAMTEQLGDEPGRDSHELYLTILRDASQVEHDSRPEEDSVELRSLLTLLRQALDRTPGTHAPARDSALSEAAIRVLAQAS